VDNAAMLVELRDPSEVEENDVIVLKKYESKDEQVDIDSTENIRTVIVNTDSEKSQFDRY
jgi:hypothetical protein